MAAARILGPLLPPEERLRRLCQSLLENRQDTRESAARAEALSILWELAFAAARYGALDEREVAAGFTPFFIPPVPSERLLVYSVIIAPETVWQIRMRKVGRAERGKGPPENRVIVKAATRQERRELALQGVISGKPVLLIEERYTVTIAQVRNAELDRTRRYALHRGGGAPELCFLGETQEPHAHFALRPEGSPQTQKWYRIDARTHPDFEIPSNVPLPAVQTVRTPAVAANEQIADLMVLFVEGTRQAVGR